MLRSLKLAAAGMLAIVLILVLFFLNRSIAFSQLESAAANLNELCANPEIKDNFNPPSLELKFLDKSLLGADVELVLHDGDETQQLKGHLAVGLLGGTFCFDDPLLALENFAAAFYTEELDYSKAQAEILIEASLFPYVREFSVSFRAPYHTGGESFKFDGTLRSSWGSLLNSVDIRNIRSDFAKVGRFYLNTEGLGLILPEESVKLRVGIEDLEVNEMLFDDRYYEGFARLSAALALETVNEGEKNYGFDSSISVDYENAGHVRLDAEVLGLDFRNSLFKELLDSDKAQGRIKLAYADRWLNKPGYEVDGSGTLTFMEGFLSNLDGAITLNARFDENSPLFSLYPAVFDAEQLKAGFCQSIIRFDKGQLSIDAMNNIKR